MWCIFVMAEFDEESSSLRQQQQHHHHHKDDEDDDGTLALLGSVRPDDIPSWRLSFHGFQRAEPSSHSPKYAFHDCLKRLGSANRVDEYYQQQDEMLEGFTEMDVITDGTREFTSKDDREKIAKGERRAIQLSNLANLFLFISKVYVSVMSMSLAIIASTLDSLLDLLSGFILWFTAVSMRQPNPYLYPIGKKRMQPLGILVFASVMATLGLQILLESARQLSYKDKQLALDGDNKAWVIGIMVFVTLVKLFLVFYCRTYKNEIVRAYAQDHFFDVITNSIGLLAAFMASEFYWWMDPVGAILMDHFSLESAETCCSSTSFKWFLDEIIPVPGSQARQNECRDTEKPFFPERFNLLIYGHESTGRISLGTRFDLFK